MGYYVVIGGTEMEPLATISGWSNTKKWADDLPLEEFVEICSFAEHGISQDIPALIAQLEKAVIKLPPKEEGVSLILAGLLQNLKAAPDGAASAFVSDGMGPDDGEPDDWHPGYDPDEDEENEDDDEEAGDEK